MTEEEQDKIILDLVDVVKRIANSLAIETEITFFLNKRIQRLENGDFGPIKLTTEEEKTLENLRSLFPDTTSI